MFDRDGDLFNKSTGKNRQLNKYQLLSNASY